MREGCGVFVVRGKVTLRRAATIFQAFQLRVIAIFIR